MAIQTIAPPKVKAQIVRTDREPGAGVMGAILTLIAGPVTRGTDFRGRLTGVDILG